MNLLARQAESLFWLGRYIERASSLARIIMVQTAFDRGRANGSSWGWLLALYDESNDFHKRYDEASSENVIRYFLNDPEHAGSVLRSLEAARSNARALRAMIATDFWMHSNRAYRRVKELPDSALNEMRLAATSEAIQIDCYALLGISSSTLYRDAGWRFFQLGLEIERADQMSRLLDVRFAQSQIGEADGELIGDFAHWTMLLRACGGHHAYRRLVSGPLQPRNVARFLIFEKSFARSISHCLRSVDQSVGELRKICRVPTPDRLLVRISDLKALVKQARKDPELVAHLHGFNDTVQRHLAELTQELSSCYFEVEVAADVAEAATAPASEVPDWVENGQPADDRDDNQDTHRVTDVDPSQSQSQSQT
ncbi:MAG: alpha-E domain-containing protein [Alphaproteobacteria bacterium]|nr:alpha-E domain-containing protein [Alphaproteobacteria bacterium]